MAFFNNPISYRGIANAIDLHAENMERIKKVANSNVEKCKEMVVGNDLASTVFVRTLGAYLKTRSQEYRFFCFDNYDAIEKRNNYIVRTVQAILSNDIDTQREMLKEENIKHFKGVFSHRLYDILVARRDELENASELQPQVTVQQAQTP